MASNSKVTRINNRGPSSIVAGTFLILADYTDQDPANPPTGTVSVNVDYADAEDAGLLQDAIAAAVLAAGASEVLWTL